MTQEIFLEPDEVEALEPTEGDARHQVWLSPFALPRSLSLRFDQVSMRLTVDIGYAAEEAVLPRRPLDPDAAPAILVRTAVHTQKVVELVIEPSTDTGDLVRVAERLRAAAKRDDVTSRRLSYLMIAELLPVVARKIGEAPPFTPKPR